MRALVVLPSYNERENVIPIAEAILAQSAELHVCIVDDSSPDGTSEHVRAVLAAHPEWQERITLITRAKKGGRGGAVREGLAWGVRQGAQFRCYIEMDCDFSHDPSAIDAGYARVLGGADVVVGARYPAGTIIGWPAGRRAFSFLANALARIAIDRSVADYTNGFRFYSPRAVDHIIHHEQQHHGYIYLSETLSLLLRAGMRVESFPIVFKNRERGVSNTNLAEIRAALGGLASIAWRHRFDRTRGR